MTSDGGPGVMPAPPAFTVIVATYSRGAAIVPTLTSIAQQSWKDFEVLVVSDGPAADGLGEAVASMDSRFRLIINEPSSRSQAGPNMHGSFARAGGGLQPRFAP